MVRAFGYSSNGGPDVQEFLDREMPTPLGGELLVEVRAAEVNAVAWKARAAEAPAAVAIVDASGNVRDRGQFLVTCRCTRRIS
ncbi:hypothetical protein [Mycolicibacterium baixiangningiae]|uniref:hypothetical protein n=1 Tax=Mycolicibacterium baixiangningiae TaxID=2761578 RepID=UPI0018D008A1|nr:hypothetical protein [Mycolicibacterium baixiangningiae]